jgi:diguanylate cyclase (GGDEF)-like protein
MKILLVEDSPTLRHVLTNDIKHAGHQVIIAQSGEEALQIVETAKVDMILMDVEMPGLDGFETTRLIREMLGDHWIPIIFVTGKDNEEDLALGIDVGGDDYLTKPVKRVILQAKIRAMERIIAIRDQLRHLNLELRDLSERDSLTKLYNRRVFQARAEERWRQSIRSHEPMAILLLDIDHFKRYNDCYGHVAGDDCIFQVANAIARCVNRPGDVLARYGGEEFIALLHNTGEQGALHVAEAIRQSVASLQIPHQDSPTAPHVSLSIGGSVISLTTGTNLLEQINSADKWLYSAKQNGRNRCVIKVFNPQNNLLVVDAKGDVTESVDRALHGQFSLHTALDAESALLMAKEYQPDVVVLDAQLPGNSAISLVHQLRSLPETAQIPVLWVTEHASDYVTLSSSSELRIDGFLTKPLDEHKLVTKVDSFLK